MVVGTPEMAIAHIEQLQRISGGFGTFLIEHGELADPAASQRSYDLFAREVVPHFSRANAPRLAAWDRELAADGLTRRTMAAAQARAGVQDATERSAHRAEDRATAAARAAEEGPAPEQVPAERTAVPELVPAERTAVPEQVSARAATRRGWSSWLGSR
jgi:hypothetical protein